jgi:hypothetical protein
MKKRISVDLGQDAFYMLKALCFHEQRSAANMLRVTLLKYYENSDLKEDIDLADKFFEEDGIRTEGN